MNHKTFAGFALALSLAAPVFSKSATFEAGALQVERQGTKGPVVILIPGLASGSWVWTDTAQRLQKDHVVYLLTLPGFDGRAPLAGTTLGTLAGDIGTLIESKRIDHPVLVGHSLGGTVSLAFAADHSDLIAGVIAVVGALACGIGLIVSIPVASLFLVYTYRKLTNGVVAPLTP